MFVRVLVAHAFIRVRTFPGLSFHIHLVGIEISAELHTFLKCAIVIEDSSALSSTERINEFDDCSLE